MPLSHGAGGTRGTTTAQASELRTQQGHKRKAFLVFRSLSLLAWPGWPCLRLHGRALLHDAAECRLQRGCSSSAALSPACLHAQAQQRCLAPGIGSVPFFFVLPPVDLAIMDARVHPPLPPGLGFPFVEGALTASLYQPEPRKSSPRTSLAWGHPAVSVGGSGAGRIRQQCQWQRQAHPLWHLGFAPVQVLEPLHLSGWLPCAFVYAACGSGLG